MTSRGQGSNRGKSGGKKSYAAAATSKSTYNDEKSESKIPEVFMLSGRLPSSSSTAKWLGGMHAHAGQAFSRHEMHWWLHPTITRKPRVPVEPDRPLRIEYEDNDLQQYQLEIDLYKELMKEYRHKREEIRQDKVKLFNYLVAHIDSETQNTISVRKDLGIFTREDPEELIAAIKTIFLGHAVGTVGNSIDVSAVEKKFTNLSQRANQSAAEFKIVWDREFKALIQAQVNGGATEAEALAVWTEGKKVEHYVFRINPDRMPQGNFRELHHFSSPPKPLPATLAEAYSQHCIEENRFQGTTESNSRRGNVFLTAGSTRNADRQNQQQNRSDAAGKKNQSKQPGLVADEDRPKDADGRWVCWNNLIGNCYRGDKCKLSHKSVVNGKQPPDWWLDAEKAKAKAKAIANGQTEEDIDAAVAETRAAVANSLLGAKKRD